MGDVTAGPRDGTGSYELRVKGHLDSRWTVWFDGFSLTRADDGITVLTGDIVDQAALHGVLRKLGDLGLPLISVTSTGAGEPTTRTTDPR